MSIVSKADLLKVLVNQTENESSIAQALAYEMKPELEGLEINNDVIIESENPNLIETQNIIQTNIHQKLRYWILNKQKDQIEEKQNNIKLSDIKKKVKDSQKESWHSCPLNLIANQGQWQNIWDKFLPSYRLSRQINISKTVALINQSKPIKKLPRKDIKSYNKTVYLIIERGEETYPIWPDLTLAIKSLKNLLGLERLTTVFLENGPQGKRQRIYSKKIVKKDIPKGAIVVIIGALGAIKTQQPSTAWQTELLRIHQAGHQILIISCGPLKLATNLKTNTQVHPLDPRGHIKADALLNALSNTWQAERASFRALRQQLGASLSDELSAYQSKEVKTQGGYISIKPQHIIQRIKQLNANPSDLAATQRAKQQWRKYQSCISREIEDLQSNLLNQPKLEDYPSLLKMAQKSNREDTPIKSKQWAQSILFNTMELSYFLAHKKHKTNWLPYLKEAQKVAQKQHIRLPLKHQELAAGNKKQKMIQEGQTLKLIASEELNKNENRTLITVGEKPYCEETQSLLDKTTKPQHDHLNIIDQNKHNELTYKTKPKWADRIWSNKNGLFAAHPQDLIFQYNTQKAQWALYKNNNSWASDAGVDDYGLWVQISVKKVSYRLRWIAAGSFMMGSPVKEDGRYEDETLHKVTLSQGYWLGETSCTQAFWQAVMGENPSDIKQTDKKPNNLPVTNVSWNDCQFFIIRLNSTLPMLNAQLPTEAQWEMACRAGTNTAYWWGDEMNSEYANDSDSLKVEDNLTSNQWGLKSMSGNIEEWCEDYFKVHSSADEIDPIIETGHGHGRVVRGGSFIYAARLLLSSSRYHSAANSRYGSIGLRLAAGFDPQASNSPWLHSADRTQRSEVGKEFVAKGNGE